MSEFRHFQIIVQGYNEAGLADKATIVQDKFVDLEAAKVKARALWKEIKDTTKAAFLQVFIADLDVGRNIFYHANF